MFLRTAADRRPYYLGNFPLETLPRDSLVISAEADRPPLAGIAPLAPPSGPLGRAARSYLELFSKLAEGDPAPARAPVPHDLARRTADIKGYAYFMNASQVGICHLPPNAWLGGEPIIGHDHALVILIEPERLPERGNLAREWIEPAAHEALAMRTAEVAVCVARHVRQLGFAARAHVAGNCRLDLERLAVLAGLAVRDGGQLRNPYVADGFALAAVTTEYALDCDEPLARTALTAKGLRYWLGINGATSGRERNRRARRATHMSRYPMEQVRRVARPTTLILDDEVPRVSKRAAFFDRALRGDLGDRARVERNRFAFKQPHTAGMMAPMRAMVPLQGGEPAHSTDTQRVGDPEQNARAVKSLSYFLGADLTGICEIPRYAWFSHGQDGAAIEPYHKYAIVMLIDQEYETMEGASGDDWISGAQSMRGYLRGAEIAGVMADLIRQLGISARAQTNVDSDVLHIPLVLLAGLGEMSRIGELVLNPFVGPRFKSVVLTTDLPLVPDRPIDFGLQQFCNQCRKCARECPCDAIPWGDKIMFNGYETWKPDVERCARYRLTNVKGSACGRCMKTCPLNKVVTADGPLIVRAASWCGVNLPWLKRLLAPLAVRLDDWLGNGRRNLVKKWWLDLEIVDGVCVEPRGSNARELNFGHRIDPSKQKMAIYPASAMPIPNDPTPQPLDRQAALAVAAHMETPDQAVTRRARGGAMPLHYIPTPPRSGAVAGRLPDLAAYGVPDKR